MCLHAPSNKSSNWIGNKPSWLANFLASFYIRSYMETCGYVYQILISLGLQDPYQEHRCYPFFIKFYNLSNYLKVKQFKAGFIN